MTDPVMPTPEAVPETANGNDDVAMKPIAPGFRFHPTDEEIISYYLKRKVQGKPIRLDAIAELDIYKHEPSELPEHSRLKTKDQEWYFFCALEKRQNTPTVVNRATKEGYWKKTGDDKEIKLGEELIGVVKSRVFYTGRGLNSNRTNWGMHEYYLVQNNREIDSYVLCRVFHKEHGGPATECIYAPFSEQDWHDDDEDGGGECGRASVSGVVHANGINEKIQQENHEHLVGLNELLRVIEMEDDPNTVDQDNSNDETLTTECLPLCVLNKESTLPFTKYKRKRQIDSFGSYNNSSSQNTQDHCSFPAKTMEDNEGEAVATMVPTSSSTELINHLEKEKQKMVVERETYQLELMSAELMVSFLQGTIDALCVENEELKKTNSNKG